MSRVVLCYKGGTLKRQKGFASLLRSTEDTHLPDYTKRRSWRNCLRKLQKQNSKQFNQRGAQLWDGARFELRARENQRLLFERCDVPVDPGDVEAYGIYISG